MNSIKYDPSRLVVWAEWESSGIWNPSVGAEIGKGPYLMVSHELLSLPHELSERFYTWVAWYDDFLPERPDEFPWEDFKKEGTLLAILLADFVDSRYQVEYQGLEIGGSIHL